MKFQKYMNRAFMILALCLSILAISYGANAAQKSRTALQTDLDNGKETAYNVHTDYANKTNINDSVFNLSTDSLDTLVSVLSVSGATSLTCAVNGTGVLNYISSGSGIFTGTFPEATGTGCVYTFAWSTAPAAGGDILQVLTDDSFNGVFQMAQDGGDTAVFFETAADTDELTFSSSTQGAAAQGATITLVDAATDVYLIYDNFLIGTGTEATPGATGQRP